MSKPTLRSVLTILLYCGIAICLVPYVTSELSHGIPLLIGGTVLAVTAGMLRCYLTAGDCADSRPTTKPAP